MRQCAVSDGFKVLFIGKVINPPSTKRVPADHRGTLARISDINAVAGWIAKRGWNVVFEKGGETGIVPALRNVTIDASMSKPSMLYSILHEAGHVGLFSRPGYTEMYPDGYIRLASKKNTKSLLHKMDVLTEELAAWEEGKLIARNLSIDLDEKGYKSERNRSVKTYVEWASL